VTELPEGLYGRIVAWGTGALVVLVGYLAFVAPTIDFYVEGRRELDERSAVAARMTRAAAELPNLRKAVRAIEPRKEGESLLLAGASDTIAVAALQTLVKAQAQRIGVKLSNVEILPAEAADRYSRVAIRTAFTAEYRAIVALLAGIETSRPALFIDRLELQASEETKSDATRPVLTATVDIYGLRPVQ
jgi:hypothetical protein